MTVRRLNGLARKRGNFQQQYKEAEERRAALMRRLDMLGEQARVHPAYKRSLTLLNDTFRKASVAQRSAMLVAADWMIQVLEQLAFFI